MANRSGGNCYGKDSSFLTVPKSRGYGKPCGATWRSTWVSQVAEVVGGKRGQEPLVWSSCEEMDQVNRFRIG